jgi:hypothetical protein
VNLKRTEGAEPLKKCWRLEWKRNQTGSGLEAKITDLKELKMNEKLHTEIVTITPKQAKTWLEKNNQNNRSLRMEQAKRFARDMGAGHWNLTHQGIAFYEDGTIADGQHRLMAIVLADMPMKFLVTKGLQKISSKAIDQNVPRQAFDAIAIAGGPVWIERNVVAIVRFIRTKIVNNDVQMSTPEILEFALRHESNLILANKLISGARRRHVTAAGMGANYFCAISGGESFEKLKRFSQVMITGEITNSKENAAIRLREYMMSNSECWNGTMRIDTSKRAQRAIKLFCQEQQIAKLYSPADLTYPVPE